jgi:ABC-type multidrug transport system fused ATPase/permease subunit
VSAAAQESLSNMMLVQAYGRESLVIERFHRHGLSRLWAQLASVRARATFTPLIDLIEMCGVLIVLGMGTWELARGAMTLGGLLVFVAFLTQLYTPVRGLANRLNSAYTASASAERILELLDQKPRPRELVGAVHPGRAAGRVAMTDVGYRYEGSTRDALRHITLSVDPGEFVAVVGASGAGKSTLAKLMLRFDDATEGVVALDGCDVRTLTIAGLRDNIATVLQECLIFDGTIRDNIAFGNPEAGLEEIRAAASQADADAFITALPEGYETLVGQQGRRLSGGQRQRIAIARAFVRDAPIVLLDEPSAGLDPASFERVMAPMLRLAQGRATLVISHNLLTVRHATRIYVLDAGQVAEVGTHEELLRRDGTYAALYRHSRDREAQSRFILPVNVRDGRRESAAEYHRAALAIANVVRDAGREIFHDELADLEARYWRLRPRYGEGPLRRAKLAPQLGAFDGAP